MVDDFEFSNTKQIRKTLLITSFAGMCYKILVKNSTGQIEFFGFKIPIKDASIIPYLFSCVIIFEIFALLIRYFDESRKEKYKVYLKYIQDNNLSNINLEYNDKFVPQSLKPNYTYNRIIKKFVFFLDFIFPLLFGFASLFIIFKD